jgi:hypothetical protein
LNNDLTANEVLRMLQEKKKEARPCDVYSLINLGLLKSRKIGSNYVVSRDSVKTVLLLMQK